MLKNLTYQQKLKYLGFAAILLLVIVYRFSVSKTITEYKQYKQAYAANNNRNNDTYSLPLLQGKERNIDEVLNRFLLDTLDQSKNLLDAAGNFCAENDLVVKEYRPGPIRQADSLQILTRTLTVEGGFTNCLKLLHYLETRSNIGKVSSVLFKSYSNPNNTQTYLHCTLFIQNLIPDKNEKK